MDLGVVVKVGGTTKDERGFKAISQASDERLEYLRAGNASRICFPGLTLIP